MVCNSQLERILEIKKKLKFNLLAPHEEAAIRTALGDGRLPVRADLINIVDPLP
jgi:hypothetical protein